MENHPLGLCDAASLRPVDLVVIETQYHDRIGENYFAKSHEGHQWFFYPALTRDEALLIKQWNSAGELACGRAAKPDAARPDAPCSFSFHSSLQDPITREDAPDRWSIEVRCMALWDHDTTAA